MPKLPHAVTHTACESGSYNDVQIDRGEPLTLTEPRVALSLPLPLSSSAKPRVYFPSRLFCIVHVLAKVSSVWPVRISSQSLARADEYEMDVIGGNLREARGRDKDVAFLTKEPMLNCEGKVHCTFKKD